MGRTCPVDVRVSKTPDGCAIDLADQEWRSIEVTKDGWKILAEASVKFQRPPGLAALPVPRDGGKLRDVTRFLNVGEQAEILLLTWMTYCLCPPAPYPVVAVSGSQGSGKSTTSRVLRSLIDPSAAMLTTVPRSERDLVIAAGNSHVIAMDNVGEISAQLSDWLCRVSTGGGLRTRELYSNNREQIFNFMRPIVVNGISDLPTRSDLLDRTLLIHIDPIGESKRMDESTFWRLFNEIRPRLFGRMLDAIQIGLGRLPSVKLDKLPRMADYCKWGVAIEEAIGFPAGSFLRAYDNNREDTHAAAIDASPLAQAVVFYLDRERAEWAGTSLQLLMTITEFLKTPNLKHPEIERLLHHPKFPNSPATLSNELGRVEPNLERLGIKLERPRRRYNARIWMLKRIA